jgi:hypothetical protein
MGAEGFEMRGEVSTELYENRHSCISDKNVGFQNLPACRVVGSWGK